MIGCSRYAQYVILLSGTHAGQERNSFTQPINVEQNCRKSSVKESGSCLSTHEFDGNSWSIEQTELRYSAVSNVPLYIDLKLDTGFWHTHHLVGLIQWETKWSMWIFDHNLWMGIIEISFRRCHPDKYSHFPVNLKQKQKDNLTAYSCHCPSGSPLPHKHNCSWPTANHNWIL